VRDGRRRPEVGAGVDDRRGPQIRQQEPVARRRGGPGRDQRGLRVVDDRGHPRPETRPREGQRQRRRHRAGAPDRRERRADRGVAAPRAGGPQAEARRGHALHGRRQRARAGDRTSMNFTLSPEEALIQGTAREFADKELAPLASAIDREGKIPREILDKMASLGFLGMLTPEQYGGVGLTNLALALVQLEINRACASTGVTMSVHNSLCQSPLLRFGTEEQKKKYLPKLARGEWIGAYSLTEPVSGTDAAALITTATKDGSDYVVNGTKNFVTNGGFADLFILFARTNPAPEAKQSGISAFLVERTSKGLTVGKNEKKMGIR